MNLDISFHVIITVIFFSLMGAGAVFGFYDMLIAEHPPKVVLMRRLESILDKNIRGQDRLIADFCKQYRLDQSKLDLLYAEGDYWCDYDGEITEENLQLVA